MKDLQDEVDQLQASLSSSSVDTPVKVAHLGISSVISIVDDILIEHMRKYYARRYKETYYPITVRDEDYRAKRITAYLNLLHTIVQKQLASLKSSAFEKGSEIVKYFGWQMSDTTEIAIGIPIIIFLSDEQSKNKALFFVRIFKTYSCQNLAV